MRRNVRLGGYLLALLVLVGALVAGPQAWATPAQTHHGQTVPTPTPKGLPSPTARPTSKPPSATPVPPATAPPPAQTPTTAPTATVAPTDTPTPAAELALAKEVAGEQTWPGATVHYTLTLTNRGTGSARAVTLVDTLPEGLEPGTVSPGTDVTWEGRTLRARTTVLPPGGQWVVAFNATVRMDVVPGLVLVNRAEATAAGGLQAQASIAVVLPPAELPPTGGTFDCRQRVSDFGF